MQNKVEIEKIYALTPMQKGMFLHEHLEKNDNAYIEQSTFTIKGDLDVDIFEKSFNKIIERYDVFRTTFISEVADEPIQVVIKESSLKVHYEDITNKKENKKVYIENFEKQDREKGFDLTKAPLMRVSAFKVDEREFTIVWSFHHIIMDGWCMGILIDELFKFYDSLKGNESLSLSNPYHYYSYIKWIQDQDENEAKEFWNSYLEGYDKRASLIELETDKNKKEYILSEKEFKINNEITGQLNNIARNCGVTLNSLIQTIWGVLLQKYNNMDDVVFGAVVSGRPPQLTGVESIVGLFINTIPVRIENNLNKSFREILIEHQNRMLESEKYHYYSLSKNQSNSKVKDNLITHILAFENYPESNMKTKSNLLIGNVKSFEQTNYDLNVIVLPGEQLTFRINYNEAVYSSETIEKLEGNVLTIVNALLNDIDISIDNIEISPKAEKQKLLEDFNKTDKDYVINKTVKELFENQVNKTPNNVAVCFEDKKMTYKELNEMANKLAALLKGKVSKNKDSIIGIMTTRSIDMIVGMLAILKAGAAYLPIDTEYPEDRIQYMLENSKTELLITQRDINKINNFNGEVIYIDDESSFTEELDSEEFIGDSNSLAYIIYTSGTTGRPKGVMIENRNLINLCDWHINRYNITENDRSAQYASISFDACVWEIWPYLLSGAAIYIVPDELRLDMNRLNDFYNENKITVCFLPTQVCQNFMSETDNNSLRILLTGGDKLKSYKKNNYTIVNNYGPTENTVVTTCFEVNKLENNIPIGKPIDNSKIYILSSRNKLLPMGAVGEICISGKGLARGYLNNIELTDKKFVDNPYEPGEKMYKTGDLGRWMPDGNIEFMGRADYQVKIRGYRIELGEIETNLLKIKSVKEAYVTDIEERDNKYLCAYIVINDDISIEEIKDKLKKYLPAYMVPTYFVKLNKLPLTKNGKVDRKELPKPEIKNNNIVEKPKNEVEEKILMVWKDILQIEFIDVNDNFFEIGGTSLLVINLQSRIDKLYPGKVKITDIFANPTVREISNFINETIVDGEKYKKLKGLEVEEDYFINGVEEENLLIKYKIEDDKYSKTIDVINKHHLDIDVILTAISMFLNNRICKVKDQSMYLITKEEDKVMEINYNINNISDFTELFNMVKEKVNSKENDSFNLEKLINRNEFERERNVIYPLLYFKNLCTNAGDLTKLFDVLIEVEMKEEKIEIRCNYSNGRIKGSKVEELFEMYIKIFNMIINNYED